MRTLDDDWLSDVLSDLASVIEVPADGPDRIRARRAALGSPIAGWSGSPSDTPRPVRRRWPVAVALGSVAMLAIAALAVHSSKGRPAVIAGAAFGSGSAKSAVLAPEALPVAPAPATTVPQVGGPSGTPSATVPQVGTKVIKTGTVNLQVGRGQVSPTVNQLTSLVGGLGGYVQSANSSEAGSAPTANLVLRVPVDQFETLLGRARQLGTPTDVMTSGQDVTSAYVDLNARIQALQATQNQFLQILAKATSIGDILAVEQQLGAVQTQLQQLQGQQMVLADQTSYGTLTVNLSQAGSHTGATPPRGGLAKAWDHARSSFANAAEDVISASGGVLVFLLVVGLVVLAGRLAWPLVRRRLV